jgi:hypothetical protein
MLVAYGCRSHCLFALSPRAVVSRFSWFIRRKTLPQWLPNTDDACTLNP